MPTWRGKSTPKNGKWKSKWESFLDTLNRKLRLSSARRTANRSQGTHRRHNDSISERGFRTWVPSTPPSPSAAVSRCQSFVGTPLAQPLPLPLPLPRANSPTICCTDKPECDLDSKQLLFSPPPDADSVEGYIATASISSGSSIESDDPSDSRLLSPLTSDHDNGIKIASNSPSSNKHRNRSAINYRTTAESLMPTYVSCSDQDKRFSTASPKRQPLFADMQNLQITQDVLTSAPGSTISSPRNPEPQFALDHGLLKGNTRPDITLLGSGHCSSPDSGSDHISIGGDFSGQLLQPQNRGSPQCSPVASPGMKSPSPNSGIQSVTVTPLHHRAGGPSSESSMLQPEDRRQRSHQLPLPPISIPKTSYFSPNYLRATSPTVPRSPSRAETSARPGPRWKKGRLLGSGSFGFVYLGFDRESGEMCAMKEVTLFPDDSKSKESAQQLNQEIAMLICLRHPNIVRYYGSETKIGEKLYIYLEYVSGGSIYKLLQEYGKFGENAIRSYTQQILSGLAYLHSKNTIHRDIKGANILVDPNGRVKLADFGTAKHITGQYCSLSFKGSPYWMAPEVIKNSNGYNLAVDIWSLGCTVLEMATAKPPWGQHEGVAAVFKIGNSKELPEIPDHLSDEGKDFVRLCLQRNPSARPSAAQLLEHPFIRNGAPFEKHVITADDLEVMRIINNISPGILNARNLPGFDSEDTLNHHPQGVKIASGNGSPLASRNMHYPDLPIGSSNLRSPQHMRGRVSPPISSPRLTGSLCSSYLHQQHNGCDPDLSKRWSHPGRVLREMITSGHEEPSSSKNGESLLADHVYPQCLGAELSFVHYLDQEPSCSPPARADMN
ncbi:PREDICTED: mitogen-activated protein kinase kinase kinase YODA-like [Tarenaya hassleriana]|uniref:mitogen-activated protein kinase kinase kinase YODA-like n=1 Tax=Tarenaya hassleriana TaxID=28532 RepID=UPI00053C3B3A|nr:PREDICTED: mitogen-activated protein kinase kinase kinase YODA-like [Tarenaya hassleriana]